MGVTCVLISIDHERGVVRATPALAAAQRGDLAPLRLLVRELLATPRDVDEASVAVLRARLTKLEELNAPEMILEHARRMLEDATGAGREPAEADRADRGALEGLLRRWSRHGHTDIDKSWDLIHWLTDAGRRSRADGESRETFMDRALYGAGPAPAVLTDERLVGYSPPPSVVDISRALGSVDPAAWKPGALEPVAQGTRPYPLNSRSVEDDDLDYARHHFEALRFAYAQASRLGDGVAVSYG